MHDCRPSFSSWSLFTPLAYFDVGRGHRCLVKCELKRASKIRGSLVYLSLRYFGVYDSFNVDVDVENVSDLGKKSYA